eukprot:4018858-Prymnesium_polylepis.1
MRAVPAEPTPPPAAVPAAAPATTRPAAKANRENYSTGKPLEVMTKAVKDWLEKTGTYQAEENMTMPRFCALVGIPHQTFRKYVCSDVSKRLAVGCGVGGHAAAMLLPDTANFVVD